MLRRPSSVASSTAMTPEIPFMPFPTMQNSRKPIVGFLIELVVLLPYATSTPPVLWPRDSSTCRIADSATAFKIKSSMAAKLRTSDVYKILQFSLRISPIKGQSLFFNRSRDQLCDVRFLASQSPSGNYGILGCSTVCCGPLPTLSRFAGLCSCWNCIES